MNDVVEVSVTIITKVQMQLCVFPEYLTKENSNILKNGSQFILLFDDFRIGIAKNLK